MFRWPRLQKGGIALQGPDGLLLAVDRDGATATVGPLLASGLTQVSAGVWAGVASDGTLAALNGPELVESSFSFQARGGNRQGGNAPNIPTIVTFIPAYTLRDAPAIYLPSDVETEIRSDVGVQRRRNLIFFKADDAKLSTFKTEMARQQDLVGFIGHSLLTPNPERSVGLKLIDGVIVKRMPPPQIGDPGGLTEIVDRIESKARVIFIGACKLGPEFLSLWDIDQTTTNRALIVPVGSDTNTNLVAAAFVWRVIVDYMGRQGATVQDAVAAGNFKLQLEGVPESELRFQVIGGTGVRLR